MVHALVTLALEYVEFQSERMKSPTCTEIMLQKEKILEERDKIVNDGEKNAIAMSQKAQANIDKSVNYLLQEFERAVLNE